MEFKTADNKLDDDQLCKLGEQITTIRSKLRSAALAESKIHQPFGSINLSESNDKLSKKINRGYFKHLQPKVDSGFSKPDASP